jgi:hypothetical protein
VFSAEDQEWSKWLLEVEGKTIARISGGGMRYRNPLQARWKKRMDEFLAVALYTKPEMLRFPYLARVGYRVVRPVSALDERIFNMRLLIKLISCRLGVDISKVRPG